LVQYKNECVISENISNETIIFNNISEVTTITETENVAKYYEIMLIIQNLINLLNNETIKKTTEQEIYYYDKLIQNIEILLTLKDFNTT